MESDVGPHSPVAGASGDHGTRRTRIKFMKRRAESEGKVPARNIFSVKEVPIGSKKNDQRNEKVVQVEVEAAIIIVEIEIHQHF